MALNTSQLIREQARQIFNSAPISALTHLIVVVFLNLFSRDFLDNKLLTIWSIVISSLAISRFLLSWLYQKKEPKDAEPWLKLFTFLTLLVGISWACFTLFYLTVDDVVFRVVFLAISCSVIASAATILAAWQPAYYANTAPQFLTLLFVLIYSNESISYLLMAALVMFYVMISTVNRQANQTILHGIFLQHKNDDLLSELKEEIDKREEIIAGRTEAINESEERLRLSQTYGGIGTWEYNFITNLSVCSDTVMQQLGFPLTPNRSTWDDVFDAIHLDDHAHVNNVIQSHINDGKALDFEYRIIDIEGNMRWMRTKGKAEFDSNNNPIKMRGTVQDITQRKKITLELQKSEHVLRVLAEYGEEDDKNIFQLMVQQLAVSQGTRYALIAQIDPKNVDQVNTLAVWSGDSIIANFSYNLKGTPCHNVVKQDACFYPTDIQHLFPQDHLLVDMHAEGYLGVPLKDDKGSVLGIIALLDDKPMIESSQTLNLLRSLSVRASIELERMASEKKRQLSARVFSNTHEGITITDVDKVIVDVNPAFCKITGYSRDEVIGQNPSILSSGKQSPEFYQDMWQQINKQGYWQGEVWNRKKGGEIYAELLTISVLKDELDNIVNYVGMFSDITSSKRQQEQLSLMAHYDVLTGLPNRALFVDRFTQAISHSKRTNHQLAVCFLDLDNFKPVNDNFGHEVGDQLLIDVAKRITTNIREEDTISRQGGDEFALLLNDIESYDQCEQTLQRIHHALAQPYIIDGYPHKITASSGLTLYPNDDGDIDTLLRHADQAMYQAKLEGKHRYHLFNPEHDQRTIQKHHQLDEIEQALINNEFQLYYQPKVNMITGEVFGAEALIRWRHPEKGLIPPLKFLPAVEGTELESRIGNWVINEALSQLEAWHQHGISLEVSINIASHHLLSDSFFSELDTALAKHPTVYSQYLQLEILESSALGDLNTIRNIIKSCQDRLGIKVALDDFGTGYSSLTHLRNLPADTIKIDQSFVRDMLDDPSDYAIIDGIIGLSDSFNREIIAEGVEATRHGLMLLMMGCEQAQGYGIAKPMPCDELPQWLKGYIPNQEWQQFANKHHTINQNKVALFRLVTEHWRDQFISNIQSSPEVIEHWPILNSNNCPCGIWIKRAQQDQLFEAEVLQQLDRAHEELHHIAQELHLQYQDGNVDTAREGLVRLQTAFDNMNATMDKSGFEYHI